jgi:hypothetical protein
MTDTAREVAEKFLTESSSDIKSWTEIFDELGMPDPTWELFKVELSKALADAERRGYERGVKDLCRAHSEHLHDIERSFDFDAERLLTFYAQRHASPKEPKP